MLFTPRQKGLGKESFLTLADNEEVTGMFAGDIRTYKRHWANNRSSECIGAECALCKADPENFPMFRFRVNFLVSKDGKWIAKIFEGGGATYDLLVNLNKKIDITQTFVTISRHGLKQNTKYSFFPETQQPVTKEHLARIGAAQLLPLSTEQEATEKV